MKNFVKRLINFANGNFKFVIAFVLITFLLGFACYHSEPISDFDYAVGVEGVTAAIFAAGMFLGGIITFVYMWKQTQTKVGAHIKLLRVFFFGVIVCMCGGLLNIISEACEIHFGVDFHGFVYCIGQIGLGVILLFILVIVLYSIGNKCLSVYRWART